MHVFNRKILSICYTLVNFDPIFRNSTKMTSLHRSELIKLTYKLYVGYNGKTTRKKSIFKKIVH